MKRNSDFLFVSQLFMIYGLAFLLGNSTNQGCPCCRRELECFVLFFKAVVLKSAEKTIITKALEYNFFALVGKYC